MPDVAIFVVAVCAACFFTCIGLIEEDAVVISLGSGMFVLAIAFHIESIGKRIRDDIIMELNGESKEP